MGAADKITLPTVYSLGQGIGPDPDEETALKAFDAYFLGEMLRQSKPKNTTGLFDGGQAGRMYQDHLYQEMARLIAETGDFGLAASLKGTLGGNDQKASEDKSDQTNPSEKSHEANRRVGLLGEEGS